MEISEIKPVAWMGGSCPAPFDQVSDDEQRYAFHLFAEQRQVWLDYWKPHDPTLPNDVCETFWGRARYDAHATFRALPITRPDYWKTMPKTTQDKRPRS